MSYRIEKEGKTYTFMTRREADALARKQSIQFCREVETKATPEAPAQLHQQWYEIVTPREAAGRTDKPISFTLAEAKDFVTQMATSPEGRMQLHRLLMELQAAKINH